MENTQIHNILQHQQNVTDMKAFVGLSMSTSSPTLPTATSSQNSISSPPIRHLQKTSLTEQNNYLNNNISNITTNADIGAGSLYSFTPGYQRSNFRKSHTCGSLFANCNCNSPISIKKPLDNTANWKRSVKSSSIDNNNECGNDYDSNIIYIDTKKHHNIKYDLTNKQNSYNNVQSNSRQNDFLLNSNCNDHDKKHKKIFQSYSHPDTDFIFTDENKTPSIENNQHRRNSLRYNSTIITKSGKVEIKNPQRLSTPNIGNYITWDISVHPEILVKVSKKSANHNNIILEKFNNNNNNLSTDSANLSEEFGTRQQNCLNLLSENENILKKSQSLSYDDDGALLKNFENFKYNEINSQQLNTSETKLNVEQQVREIPLEQNKNYSNFHITNTKNDLIMEKNHLLMENLKIMENEMKNLRDVIKKRDNEIYKLKREIHKLKSVLQQTTHHMPIADGDILSSLQTLHCMGGQQCQLASCQNNKTINNVRLHPNNCIVVNNFPNDIGTVINYTTNNTKAIPSPSTSNNSNTKTQECDLTKTLSSHAVKKQGVSGESSDASSYQSNNVSIPKFEKDFRSKQLIKDAIMDNDFLKNIDSTQVRELVDSMYSLEIAKGEYVIREGEAGAHLYVSAEGEFEVVKNENVLGTMGPAKAFGELAILYNCTRTASIRVLSDAKVWVLDRRVFQQIMMRTGMQRIHENVNFLHSVPLLRNLTYDVLTKIADVLEVEFYPSGTYIIRQGASGNTFFLISQGTVKVTQRFGTNLEEKEIRTLERGDYFGEQALINEDKRTANIIAMAPGVECLTLDRESFTHLIGDLCELKEKNYGDENRVLDIKFAENTSKVFGCDVKQELLDVSLNDLEIITTLGIGGFGRVELVKCKREKENCIETYALKCLKKKHIIDTRQEEHVFSERTIMLSCKTPFICRLYRTFRDSKYIYMLLEACMGGEVWTILRDRGCFDERTTQFIISCVLEAFQYLHSRGIIYRDLKPENLMLDERGYVKLVDFGFAKYIGQSSKTWTFCGTPEYVAPEIILNKGHDRAVDYWSLGILIHELLSGAPPFTANDPMKTYNIILKGIDLVDFPKHMSRSAIMLIKGLCRDVPMERLGYQKGGIQDIKKHKWFQGFDWDGLANLTLIPPFLRPVSNPLDTSYFDKFPIDTEIPPDEISGWDENF